MRVQRFYFLVALLGILCSCSENNSTDFVSETINSNQGISTDTLRFVYSGPQDFNLDYFPETAIHAAKVKECTIIQQDSTSTRVARRVQFDRAGNTINDENRFFFLWFAGTMRGVYHYQYNTAGKLIKMVGIYEEDSKDSVMTVTNYNTQGLLYSEDDYHFAKQLKPGADGHLPSKNDYEEHPTWNKEKTRQFLFRVDTAIIETFVDDKIVNTEKYQLLFDSVKRLRTVNEFQNGFLKEKRDYAYEPNNITEFFDKAME